MQTKAERAEQQILLRSTEHFDNLISLPRGLLEDGYHLSYEPRVPDDELVVPRGDEEVVRQHDQVARGVTGTRELK